MGKTTLTKLLTGLYNDERHELIYYNGISIAEIERWERSDNTIMEGSLITNILLEFLGILILWLELMAIILFHETGHMIGYKLAKGDDDWNIILGVGKQLFKTKRLTVSIIPWSGMFRWEKVQAFTKMENILISAGGPLFSLMLVVIFFFIQLLFSDGVPEFIDYFRPAHRFTRDYNFVILISSIIPMKYPNFLPLMGGHTSDGMKILKALTRGKYE